MPALGNIVINDAAATPLAHTFSPVTTDGAIARFANRSATTPKGYETLSLELRAPQGSAVTYRLIGGMNDPVEGTVDGAAVVLRNCSAEFKLNFSPESTAQERKDLLKMLSNLFAHATVVTMCENVEPIY